MKKAPQATLGKTQKTGTMGKTLLGSIKGTTRYEETAAEELDPPLSLKIRCVGHSFAPGSQPFIPMVKVSPSNKVTFRPCGANESVYQTVQIVNTSDTPVFFKVLQDSTQTFRSFPPLGMIGGKSFALLCFEFHPKSPRFYNFTAQCVFNHQPSNVQSIHLAGYCYGPQISIGNNSKLFFPPTYLGVSSKSKVVVKNEARIPLEIEWQVPPKYLKEIVFEPSR